MPSIRLYAPVVGNELHQSNLMPWFDIFSTNPQESWPEGWTMDRPCGTTSSGRKNSNVSKRGHQKVSAKSVALVMQNWSRSPLVSDYDHTSIPSSKYSERIRLRLSNSISYCLLSISSNVNVDPWLLWRKYERKYSEWELMNLISNS